MALTKKPSPAARNRGTLQPRIVELRDRRWGTIPRIRAGPGPPPEGRRRRPAETRSSRQQDAGDDGVKDEVREGGALDPAGVMDHQGQGEPVQEDLEGGEVAEGLDGGAVIAAQDPEAPREDEVVGQDGGPDEAQLHPGDGEGQQVFRDQGEADDRGRGHPAQEDEPGYPSDEFCFQGEAVGRGLRAWPCHPVLIRHGFPPRSPHCEASITSGRGRRGATRPEGDGPYLSFSRSVDSKMSG